MHYFIKSVARRTIASLLVAPLLAPAFAAAEPSPAPNYENVNKTPLLLAMNTQITGADMAFERQFGTDFFREYWRLHPEQALAAGQFTSAAHTVIPDARSRAQAIGKLNEWLSQLHRFNPGSLNAANRSDWWLLNNAFEAERWTLMDYRAWAWNPALYNVAGPLAAVIYGNYASLEERLRTVLERLNDVSSYYAAARHNLVEPTREHTLQAITDNRTALQLLGPLLEQRVAGSNLRDSERALFSRRIAAARISIEEHIAWLETLEAGLAEHGGRSFRLGPELYERKFAFTVQSDGTAEEMYQRAIDEKSRLHASMAQLADAMWPRYFPQSPPPQDPLERISRTLQQLADVRNRAWTPSVDTGSPEEQGPRIVTAEYRGAAEPAQSLVRTFFGNDVTLQGWSSHRTLIALESRGDSPEAWLRYSLSSLGATCDALMDYGMHVRGMSEEEALRLLTKEAFVTSETAQARWHQAQLTSVQLAGDFAGYTEIRDLRKQLKNEMGSRFDLLTFNRQFENYDRVPVKVIRDLVRPALLAQTN